MKSNRKANKDLLKPLLIIIILAFLLVLINYLRAKYLLGNKGNLLLVLVRFIGLFLFGISLSKIKKRHKESSLRKIIIGLVLTVLIICELTLDTQYELIIHLLYIYAGFAFFD